MALRGPRFLEDNKKVWMLLKGMMIKSDGWTWCSEHDTSSNGRAAITNLRAHYDGPGESLKRIKLATAQLEKAHYRAEHIYSFEKFISDIKQADRVLDDNGRPRYEAEKVENLLAKIQSNHQSYVHE